MGISDSEWRGRSPEALYTVMIENTISAHYGSVQGLGLGYEKSIKRVFVMHRQETCPDGMFQTDRKLCKSLAMHDAIQILD